jgi:hypothetical protein
MKFYFTKNDGILHLSELRHFVMRTMQPKLNSFPAAAFFFSHFLLQKKSLPSFIFKDKVFQYFLVIERMSWKKCIKMKLKSFKESVRLNYFIE